MNTEFEKALRMRIIPVVAIQSAKSAEPLADALIAGGLPCAEITFRTAAAEDVIKTLARRGDILVGAGTVLSVEQARIAREAGARFIVAPGFDADVVRFCLDHDLAVTPGVCTPTDIQKALALGLNLVKFFPAEAIGGLKTLKAIAAPYTQMKFIPTGGINTTNLLDYLEHPQVPAVGGSWMVGSKMIAHGRFDEITELTKAAMTLVGKRDIDKI
jgi:2-dehydro-3-deoxyphosphogluconate aldolase/(4S)-4-hydroxy-2-oxoglutarate aldolase